MSQECVPSNTPTHAEADDLSEADAIRLAQEGNGAAFERIFRSYSRRVYALCLRMVRNQTDAEDLTQEAFLQLFRKIQRRITRGNSPCNFFGFASLLGCEVAL